MMSMGNGIYAIANTITFDENGVPTFGSAWTETEITPYAGPGGLVYVESESKFKTFGRNLLCSANTTYGINIYESEDGITWETKNYDTSIPFEEEVSE